MVSITKKAAQMLQGMLADIASNPWDMLRLRSGDGGFSLEVDLKRDGDEVLESGGVEVLVLDPQLSLAMAGSTIDTMHTDEGQHLTISKAQEE